ncbi:MAG: hypothetical protein QXF09_05610 [Nitrososphaerota archaeon]
MEKRVINRKNYLSLFIIVILLTITINIIMPSASCLENIFEKENYSFIENWHDSLFWLNVTIGDNFTINTKVNIEVVIKAIYLKENNSIYFYSFETGILNTNVIAFKPILKNFTSIENETKIDLSLYLSDPSFNEIKPGEEKIYQLYLKIYGQIRNEKNETYKMETFRTINVILYSPKSIVTIDYKVPEIIEEGEDFNILIRILNEGNYPIKDVALYIYGYKVEVLTNSYKRINVIEANNYAEITFPIRIKQMGFYTINIDLAYKSFGGYNVTKSESILINVRGRSELTCKANVENDGKILIYGILNPKKSNEKIFLSYSFDNGKTWNNLGETFTIENGSYYYYWKPNKKGEYLIKAEWDGDEYYLNSESKEVKVEINKEYSKITLILNSNNIFENEKAIINGEIIPNREKAIVILYYSLDKEKWDIISIINVENGEKFEYNWEPKKEGTYYIKAVLESNEEYYGAETMPIKLNVNKKTYSLIEEIEKIFTTQITIILVIVIIVLSIILFLRKKKKV